MCCLVPLISHPPNSDREKEREHESLDVAHNEANKSLQQVETTLTNMKAQLKSKKEEVQGLFYSLHPPCPSRLTQEFLTGLEKKIKQGIKEELYGSNSTVEAAYQVASDEVNQRGK